MRRQNSQVAQANGTTPITKTTESCTVTPRGPMTLITVSGSEGTAAKAEDDAKRRTPSCEAKPKLKDFECDPSPEQHVLGASSISLCAGENFVRVGYFLNAGTEN
mmetsp:Transcript_35828/g.48406  ORF Transcript_35828/g.48406 Transcript_35828/m.48406 type:complete len:105 (-) Transcript_35828:72-386(-)